MTSARGIFDASLSTAAVRAGVHTGGSPCDRVEAVSFGKAPAICDANLVELVAGVCRRNGISHRKLISRAYHDSLFMAQVCPTTMVFIPCRGGVSHRPDEYSSPEQIETGVRVLAETLAELAMAH